MIKVAVFLGGKSAEKLVSKASGAAVINALRENKEYKIFRCDPADKDQMKEFLELVRQSQVDVVFNALHGTGAEDGEMQGFLKTLGVPFTGPQVHAASIAFDKISTKRILRDASIPVTTDLTFEKIGEKWRITFNDSVIQESEYYDHITDDVLDYWGKKFEYFGFAKAAREGSSVGVYLVEGREKFLETLHEMMNEYPRILFEEKSSGVEVTISVVGGKALEMTEIVAEKGSFYDYESKYSNGGSIHYLPPRTIKDATKKKFQEVSQSIGFLLDIDCPYRIDGFIDGDNFVIMEINTLPGMTDTSLLPEAYKFQGKKYTFARMCDEMITSALRK